MGEKNHKPGDPWTCDRCRNEFSTRDDLRQHIRQTHGNGRGNSAKGNSETKKLRKRESTREQTDSIQNKATSSNVQSSVPLSDRHSPEIPVPSTNGIRKKTLVSTGTQTIVFEKKTVGTQAGSDSLTYSKKAPDSISVDSLSWMNEISSDSETETDPSNELKNIPRKRIREPTPRSSSSDSDGGNADDDEDDDDSSSYDSQEEWFPPQVKQPKWQIKLFKSGNEISDEDEEIDYPDSD